MFFVPWGDVAFPKPGVYDRLGGDIYFDHDWESSINMFKKSVDGGKKTFMYLHSYDVHQFYFLDEPQIYEPINTKFPTSESDFWSSLKITPTLANQVVGDAIFEIQNGFQNNYCWYTHPKLATSLLQKLIEVSPDFSKEKPILEEMMDNFLLNCNYFDEQYNNMIDTNNSNDIEVLKALYDQEINILDRSKIPLITELVSDPKYKENTILIIYSEHGSEFMEHGHMWHETIYNPNIKIPLIMYIPGIKAKKIYKPVQLVDILPTINELLGMNTDIQYDGHSLVKKIFGVSLNNEVVVVDGWRFQNKAIIYDEWKLFLNLNEQDNTYEPIELYNLKNDPEEKNNVLFENPKTKDMLMKKYLNTLQNKKAN